MGGHDGMHDSQNIILPLMQAIMSLVGEGDEGRVGWQGAGGQQGGLPLPDTLPEGFPVNVMVKRVLIQILATLLGLG